MNVTSSAKNENAFSSDFVLTRNAQIHDNLPFNILLLGYFLDKRERVFKVASGREHSVIFFHRSHIGWQDFVSLNLSFIFTFAAIQWMIFC